MSSRRNKGMPAEQWGFKNENPARELTLYSSGAIIAACLTGLAFGFDIGTGDIFNSDGFRQDVGWPAVGSPEDVSLDHSESKS